MTHTVPYHILKNITELYNVSKNKLGSTKKQRKEIFITILKSNYPWESRKFLERYYTTIEDLEDAHIKIKENELFRNTYNNDIISIFGVVDHDKNGSICFEEFKNATKGLEIDHKEIFEDADTDNNGRLDLYEFHVLLNKHPTLKKNIKTIISNGKRNKKKVMERIFKNDITNRRPSLVDIKDITDILQSDVLNKYFELK